MGRSKNFHYKNSQIEDLDSHIPDCIFHKNYRQFFQTYQMSLILKTVKIYFWNFITLPFSASQLSPKFFPSFEKNGQNLGIFPTLIENLGKSHLSKNPPNPCKIRLYSHYAVSVFSFSQVLTRFSLCSYKFHFCRFTNYIFCSPLRHNL